MTARRSKPSFASLLRRAERATAVETIEPEPATEAAPAEAPTAFEVDPVRVRLWPRLGRVAPTREGCEAILRDGQAAPVTVRPVFDDELFEYEAIDGAATFAAVRRLRESDPALGLLIRVALVDDEGAAALALAEALPPEIGAAFAGEVPAEAAAMLAERLDGPLGATLLATARQVARAQVARRDDGLPPYPAIEVMRLLDAVGVAPPSPPAERLSLAIADADATSVTFRLTARDALPPETLARAIKAMLDGAASDGFVVEWKD